MIYLRTVRIEHVWKHAGIDWEQALPGAAPRGDAFWLLATPVRDESMSIEDSKFYKSVRGECDDAGKKASLLTMLNQLRYAMRHEDYQGFLKNSNVQVKDAFRFTYRAKTHKVWELKFQNKDRVYFFSHQTTGAENKRVLIPMLFHHKKDQTTPKGVCDYCEKVMKPFLDPDSKIEIIKESK